MERNNLNHGAKILDWVPSSHKWMLRILLILVLLGIHGTTVRPLPAQATTQSLTLSGNGRYFLQGSTPFFWLGDTSWMLFSNGSLAGSPNSEVDQYLQDRKSRGFTVIQSFLVDWQPMRPNRQGHVPFFNNDLGQPNPAYFNDVEAIIDKAAALGLQMAIGPAALGGAAPYFNESAAHIYGSYLAWRFRFKTNIIWMLCGDLDPNMALSEVRAMADGLRTSDFTHPITCHPPGLSSSRQLIPGEAWQNFSMIQLGPKALAETYSLINSDYNLSPPKPTGNCEPWYELYLGATAYDMRRSAYWTFMAGGSYYTYGNHWIWNFDPGWQTGLGTLGGVQLATYYKGLLTERQWWKYEPDQSVIASGAGSALTLNAAVRSSEGNSILVYLSHSGSNVAINMNRFTAGSAVRARWYNPTNGQYTTIGDYSNSGIQSFATPGGWQDAVLVLETPGASSPPSVTVAPSSVGPGGTVTVSWAGGASVTDWVGLYATGAKNEERLDWRFTSSCAYTPGNAARISGSCSFTMPLTPGKYEFRLFANNSFVVLATSGMVAVTATLTVSPGSVGPGGPVAVSWAGVSGGTVTDWVGLYAIGAGYGERLDWRFTSSCADTPGSTPRISGSCSFTMPLTPGKYEFRLFGNNSFVVLATSGVVALTATLTASPGSVGAGGAVTASWTGSSSPTDWIACFGAGAGDGSYSDWKFTSTCAQSLGGSVSSSGSCTFKMPSAAGAYEFRLFANGTFFRLAISNNVTVTGGGGGNVGQ
jgi:Protein of unknown function (DUF4038)/Putative collagen-binding domain of a collagenase